MDSTEVTYEQERGPAGPSMDQYILRCQAQWAALLNRNPSEAEVQDYLEWNPALVPGAWTPGSVSGHYPVHCALIAQPQLPGLTGPRPDFMWVAKHSGSWFPTLIEIEAPAKRVFTKAGRPTSEFSQARNQLAQWRTWFASPVNVLKFMDTYGIEGAITRGRIMQLHMILVFGRRDEFDGRPELSQARSSLLPGDDEELVSFDRLCVDESLREAITVRCIDHGRYEAKRIPPTFGTSPDMADRLLHISAMTKAIDCIDGVSEERRQFLKRRVDYWRGWASKGSSRFFGGGRYVE